MPGGIARILQRCSDIFFMLTQCVLIELITNFF